MEHILHVCFKDISVQLVLICLISPASCNARAFILGEIIIKGRQCTSGVAIATPCHCCPSTCSRAFAFGCYKWKLEEDEYSNTHAVSIKGKSCNYILVRQAISAAKNLSLY